MRYSLALLAAFAALPCFAKAQPAPPPVPTQPELIRAAAVKKLLPPAERLPAVPLPKDKQCTKGDRKTCITPMPCPTAKKHDFFHFSELSSCLSVHGTISEMYAPTPASDAVRFVERDLATLQIPNDWITNATYDGTLGLQVDAGYFGRYSDSIQAKLHIGEGTGVTSPDFLGPFSNYYQMHGLQGPLLEHTMIELLPGKDHYRYTLYSALGEPLHEEVEGSNAYFVSSELRSLLAEKKAIYAYSLSRRFSFACSEPETKGQKVSGFNECKGNITFSPYVTLVFDWKFGEPLARDMVIKTFNDFYLGVRPLYLEGSSAYVKPPTDDAPPTKGYYE